MTLFVNLLHDSLFNSVQRCLACWLLGFVIILGSGTATAQGGSNAGERRVALVVGNSAYKSSPLKNPGNDAIAIAASLRKLGFEVIEKQNLTREGFSLAAREFGDRLRGATVGLFYFAGHGLQVRGRNFLVPVDADIAREDEVPYRSLDVNEVLDKMDGARTPINLVLLDACRNNPFARSFKLSQIGLAQMDAPAGTLIAFATSPGSVAQDGEGSNGLYTSALLKHMGTESLPIEQMLKRVRVDVARSSNNGQIPWESSSLNRDFTFLLPATLATQAPQSASNGVTELALDLAFWDAIKNSTRSADYSAYLDQHPQGRFAYLARLRAGTVQSTISVAPPVVPVTASTAGSTGLTAVSTAVQTSAKSPEGLYVALVSSGQLQLTDINKSLVIRSYPIENGSSFIADRSGFSPDGRWLLIGGLRAGKPAQLLLAVSSGRFVWERSASGAAFDANQAAVSLQWPDGRVELLSLADGAQ